MIKLNVPYKCTFCKRTFFVLLGNGKFKSYLPVEIINGTEINDTIYDKDKGHKSHLLSCPGLQKQWEVIKAQIDKQENKSLKVK